MSKPQSKPKSSFLAFDKGGKCVGEFFLLLLADMGIDLQGDAEV